MTPMAVVAVAWAFGVRSPRPKAFSSVLLVVCGGLIASYGAVDYKSKGFAFLAAGVAFEATRLVLIQRIVSTADDPMDALVYLYHSSPVCMTFNFAAFLVFEAKKMRLDDMARAGLFTLSLNALSAFALDVLMVSLVRNFSLDHHCLTKNTD